MPPPPPETKRKARFRLFRSSKEPPVKSSGDASTRTASPPNLSSSKAASVATPTTTPTTRPDSRGFSIRSAEVIPNSYGSNGSATDANGLSPRRAQTPSGFVNSGASMLSQHQAATYTNPLMAYGGFGAALGFSNPGASVSPTAVSMATSVSGGNDMSTHNTSINNAFQHNVATPISGMGTNASFINATTSTTSVNLPSFLQLNDSPGMRHDENITSSFNCSSGPSFRRGGGGGLDGSSTGEFPSVASQPFARHGLLPPGAYSAIFTQNSRGVASVSPSASRAAGALSVGAPFVSAHSSCVDTSLVPQPPPVGPPSGSTTSARHSVTWTQSLQNHGTTPGTPSFLPNMSGAPSSIIPATGSSSNDSPISTTPNATIRGQNPMTATQAFTEVAAAESTPTRRSGVGVGYAAAGDGEAPVPSIALNSARSTASTMTSVETTSPGTSIRASVADPSFMCTSPSEYASRMAESISARSLAGRSIAVPSTVMVPAPPQSPLQAQSQGPPPPRGALDLNVDIGAVATLLKDDAPTPQLLSDLTTLLSTHLAKALQCTQLLSATAPELRYGFGDQRAVMSLYEAAGLEVPPPVSTSHDSGRLQQRLQRYRFPPPQMEALRGVDHVDADTLHFMLGEEEVARRARMAERQARDLEKSRAAEPVPFDRKAHETSSRNQAMFAKRRGGVAAFSRPEEIAGHRREVILSASWSDDDAESEGSEAEDGT